MKSGKHNFVVGIFRKAKLNFYSIYRARGSAHEIALGAAIGAFWGVFPTFGLSTVLSLALYKLFRFNLLAAISAAFISNPITSPFLLMISYKVGTFVLQKEVPLDLEHWYKNLSTVGYVFLLGATIVSFVTAVVVYYLIKYAIERRRKPATHHPIPLS